MWPVTNAHPSTGWPACLSTLLGHSAPVSSVCLSVDGQRIVSGSADNTVKIWDVATGSCVTTLQGHSNPVTSVCLSVDGQRIVSGSYDKTVKIWDVATGSCVTTLQGHSKLVSSVCLSVDGQTVTSNDISGKSLHWDVSSGTQLSTPINSIAVQTASPPPNTEGLVISSSSNECLFRYPHNSSTALMIPFPHAMNRIDWRQLYDSSGVFVCSTLAHPYNLNVFRVQNWLSMSS